MTPRTRLRCLAVAGVYPPAGGAGAVRAERLLSTLARDHDWEVHVIAPPDGGGFYADTSLPRAVPHLHVHRLGAPLRPRQGGAFQRARIALRRSLSIPDEYIGWALAAARFIRAHLKSLAPDVLASFSFPYSAHLAVRIAAGGRPWLADFADPWVGHRFRSLDTIPRRWLHEPLEHTVARRANHIFVASPGMQRILQARYPYDAQKVSVLLNPYDAYASEALDPPSCLPPYRVLFVGTLDRRISPVAPILEALRHLLLERPLSRNTLQVDLVGGADRANLRAIAAWQQTHSYTMLRHFPFEPQSQIRRRLSQAHVLLLSIAHDVPWQLTAKLPEYLVTGRPILAICPTSDCRDTLLKTGGARLVAPQDTRALAAAFSEIMDTGTLNVAAHNRSEIKAFSSYRVASHWNEVARNQVG